MDERNYLTTPWYEIRRLSWTSSGSSSSRKSYGLPRDGFRELVRRARQVDERLYVVLSPRVDQDACAEWEAAARGGESIWETALKAREDETYGMDLPRKSTGSRNR
ncbi:hypothetical protein SCP_0211420 [Sparassis crispa]|uniref:Uncharacterized protein n=1 Tax=Sparassis crispa TaxID=139825 RepID=A0A401GCQ2_9APHY|nr:hypothetical protein SCP_0211420 [Sparassis crispa]GBE79940.1 hypothetical protein SCP_0211420 [Sparassis crispa]